MSSPPEPEERRPEEPEQGADAAAPPDADARPRGRPRLRRVLGGVLLLFVVAAVLGWLTSPLWPVRIVEGPLVQLAGEDGVTLVWYLSKPAACELVVRVGDSTRSIPVARGAPRCAVRVEGLEPGRSWPYEIRAGTRVLALDAFQTNRAAGQPWRMIVFGDSGRGKSDQYQLAAAMEQSRPDVLLHTGDLVYPGGERSDYRAKFFEPYAPLLRRVPFWPCLGNHDINKPEFGAAYYSVFELPGNGPADVTAERNYWFDYSNARIAVVDSNLDEATLRERVAPWLSAVFRDYAGDWRFVSLHHPAVSVGKHGPTERVQAALVPVFESAGVDLVFCGHDHIYERTAALRGEQVVEPGEGVVYVVTGAGGAKLYEIAPPDQRPAYVRAVNNTDHSFTVLDIHGRRLELRQLTRASATIDEWVWEKPPRVARPAAPVWP